jgi:hypothetical protein
VIYVHAEGKTAKQNSEGNTMKKATWIVKAYTGYKTGWQEIKSFSSPAAADEWLCNYVRANGYSITDFNIIRK